MKNILSLCVLGLLVGSCNQAPKAETAATDAFQRNCETVKANLEAFQSESLDYTMYADNFWMPNTSFNQSTDTLRLVDLIAVDAERWAQFDYELTSPLFLLPGVNGTTREPNSSVRYYGIWKITRPATDTTEAKSVEISLYESFDFNDEGQILIQQYYGDFGAAMQSLN